MALDWFSRNGHLPEEPQRLLDEFVALMVKAGRWNRSADAVCKFLMSAGATMSISTNNRILAILCPPNEGEGIVWQSRLKKKKKEKNDKEEKEKE